MDEDIDLLGLVNAKPGNEELIFEENKDTATSTKEPQTRQAFVAPPEEPPAPLQPTPSEEP